MATLSRNIEYRICMMNVNFDDSYNNVLYFKDPSMQITYFIEEYELSFDNAPLVNFNINDGLNTEAVINMTDKEYTPLEQTQYNYCIIRQVNKSKDTYQYLYYFIKDIKYLTNGQVSLTLKLDVFNTYPINNYINDIPKCDIKRAHLNRFIEQGNNYKFNMNEDSPFYIKEDLEFNKRLIHTHQTSFYDSEKERTLNEWFDSAIRYWVVLFINPNYVDNSNDLNKKLGLSLYSLSTGQYQIMLYPVFNNNYRMNYRLTTAGSWNTIGWTVGNTTYTDLNTILNCEETLSANIIDIRACKIPFWFFISVYSGQIDYAIDNRTLDLTLLNNISYDSNNNPYIPNLGYFVQSTTKDSTIKKVGAFYLARTNADIQNTKSFSEKYLYPTDELNPLDNIVPYVNIEQISKTEIKESSNSPELNPKIYASTILDLILRYGQNTFTYDYLSLGKNKIKAYYYESLGPSIVRSYIYINPTGLYNSETIKDFLGIVSANDFSLTYFTDQLASYLANNKNAWLQTTFKIASNIGTTTLKSGINGGITKEGFSPTDALQSGFLGLVKSSIGAVNSIVQYNLNLDNMKSAPSAISNVQGNFTMLNCITGLDLDIEVWRPLDNDINLFNDYCLRFGYKVNKFDELINYINIRKYWNYIQAYIEELPQTYYNFNYKVENEIKNAFDRGIRFWTVADVYNDTIKFDYTLPNYEKYLDD